MELQDGVGNMPATWKASGALPWLAALLARTVAHTPPRHAGQDERRLEVSHVGKNGSKAHAQGVFAAPASSD